MTTSRQQARRTELSSVSVSDALVEALSREILDGSIEPGKYLREVDLADQFGVSRQTLRAALAELRHLGLVTRERHRGVRTAVLTKADAADLYFMRELIEGRAIRRLARTPSALPAVQAAVEVLERLPDGAPWSDIVDADVAVHRATVAAAGSPRLLRAHDQLAAEMRLVVVPARHYVAQTEMVDEHRELLEVIRRGEPDAAFARFKQHLEMGTEQLLELLPDGADH